MKGDALELSQEYPFLSAGIEDYVFAIKIAGGNVGNKRLSVCLMYDLLNLYYMKY